jgi:hypothetical protein
MTALALVPPNPDRIMSAAEIAAEKFSGHKSARWVRRNVPGRIEGSREALWFESTVDKYLARLQKESAA